MGEAPPGHPGVVATSLLLCRVGRVITQQNQSREVFERRRLGNRADPCRSVALGGVKIGLADPTDQGEFSASRWVIFHIERPISSGGEVIFVRIPAVIHHDFQHTACRGNKNHGELSRGFAGLQEKEAECSI